MHSDIHVHLAAARAADAERAARLPRPPSMRFRDRVARYWAHGEPGHGEGVRGPRGAAGRAGRRLGGHSRVAPVAGVRRG